MSIESRTARVKLVPFPEAMLAVADAVGCELPEPPATVRCPLPDHDDGSPSFSFQRSFWKCHGCNRQGDVVEFAKAFEGLAFVDALTRVESILGLESEAKGLLALATRRRAPPPERVERDRELRQRVAALDALGALAARRARPYALSPDPVARGIAVPRLDWLHDELADARLAPAALTPRARRERLRFAREWALGVVRGIERDVEATTGRDRGDAESLAPEPPRLTPLLRAVGIACLRALRAKPPADPA